MSRLFVETATLAGHTGKGVAVGIIDSGWDVARESAQIRHGVNFVSGDGLATTEVSDTHDRHGHGTLCADIAMQFATNAEVFPLRVFGSRIETSTTVLIGALEWAIERRLKVVNLSLGTRRVEALRPLYQVCERAFESGMILIATVPTPGPVPFYPAVFETVLSVGFDARLVAGSMVYLPGVACEVLAAPPLRARGRNCVSRHVRGASFAAPVVTGRVAQLSEAFPTLDLVGVRAWLAANSRAADAEAKRA
jgi:hypothetical protein